MLLLNLFEDHGYLLNGKLLKRGKFLRRTKFLFNAQNQREFTKVTSEASFRSKFKLILGIIKEFCWVKKCHVERHFHSTCNFVSHLLWLWNLLECFWDPRNWFHPKTGKKTAKTRKNYRNIKNIKKNWIEHSKKKVAVVKKKVAGALKKWEKHYKKKSCSS